jgi:hypothetical protein
LKLTTFETFLAFGTSCITSWFEFAVGLHVAGPVPPNPSGQEWVSVVFSWSKPALSFELESLCMTTKPPRDRCEVKVSASVLFVLLALTWKIGLPLSTVADPPFTASAMFDGGTAGGVAGTAWQSGQPPLAGVGDAPPQTPDVM